MLPKPKNLVIAYLEGASYHTGDDIAWRRCGWAFMVRWDDAPDETIKDGWSRRHYNYALREIGADHAQVVRWAYVEDLPKICHEVEE